MHLARLAVQCRYPLSNKMELIMGAMKFARSGDTRAFDGRRMEELGARSRGIEFSHSIPRRGAVRPPPDPGDGFDEAAELMLGARPSTIRRARESEPEEERVPRREALLLREELEPLPLRGVERGARCWCYRGPAMEPIDLEPELGYQCVQCADEAERRSRNGSVAEPENDDDLREATAPRIAEGTVPLESISSTRHVDPVPQRGPRVLNPAVCLVRLNYATAIQVAARDQGRALAGGVGARGTERERSVRGRGRPVRQGSTRGDGDDREAAREEARSPREPRPPGSRPEGSRPRTCCAPECSIGGEICCDPTCRSEETNHRHGWRCGVLRIDTTELCQAPTAPGTSIAWVEPSQLYRCADVSCAWHGHWIRSGLEQGLWSCACCLLDNAGGGWNPGTRVVLDESDPVTVQLRDLGPFQEGTPPAVRGGNPLLPHNWREPEAANRR